MLSHLGFVFTRSRLTALTVAGLAGSLLAHPVAAQEGGIPVGTSAPGAPVFTLDGKAVDLSAYLGKTPVVFEFWATWCPLCKKLEPAMAAAHREYAGRVRFVSVGVPDNQSPDRQKAYVDEKHLEGDFVFDRDSKAIAAYKVPHTSYIVVVNVGGKVVYTGVGADQDISAAVGKAFDMRDGMHR
jgi:thiol-disulfide isomerase/thioredoxin